MMETGTKPKSTELATRERAVVQREHVAEILSVEQIVARVEKVKDVIRAIFHRGIHYGPPYPGSSETTMYQPGANALMLAFGVAPEFTVEQAIREDKFISYMIRCQLIAGGDRVIAQGIGSCNSREKKYRRKDGDPWDLDHTLLMMAQKRAKLAAVDTLLSAKGVLLEELMASRNGGGSKGQPAAQPKPQQQPQQPPMTNPVDWEQALEGAGSVDELNRTWDEAVRQGAGNPELFGKKEEIAKRLS
jgi:hypothetical protein